MKRVLLTFAVALAVAGAAIVIARKQNHVPPGSPLNPRAAFVDALRRHDYRRAYALTDLPFLRITGASSAVTLAHFTAFAKTNPLGRLSVEQEAVHVPTTDLRITAPTGPLPSLTVDGVGVSLLEQRVNAGRVSAAAWRYTYAIVVISGPHSLTVGSGPVTAARSLTGVFRGNAASVGVSLTVSTQGNSRVVGALHTIRGTCPGDLCVVAPCAGRGTEYVLDAHGVGFDPIVARALVGDSVIAPMPPDGWSIAITFVAQGQPPALSGKEQTRQVRARYVFGFVGGGRAQLLDRCWTIVT